MDIDIKISHIKKSWANNYHNTVNYYYETSNLYYRAMKISYLFDSEF